MKTLFAAALSVFMLFAFTLNDAEARKLGGKKRSLGSTFQTAPANKGTQANNTAGTAAGTAAQAGAKGGMMKGLLGGLLAGGLIAALLGGGFEGFQIFDFLIIALLAFLGFKLFKHFKQQKQAQQAQASPQAFAGAAPAGGPSGGLPPLGEHNNGGAMGSGGLGGGLGAAASNVPMDLPAGFNAAEFLQGAQQHYRDVQAAWNSADMNKLREYFSSELYEQLAAERAEEADKLHTEILSLDASIVRAEQSSDAAQLSVAFTGRYRDTAENLEEDIQDVWHLRRDLSQLNAPWLVVGIES